MKKKTLLILELLISSNYVMSQENKISTSEMIINSTIRIECTGDTIIKNQKQNFTSTGTGFFFEFLIKGNRIPVIITNHHVIKSSNIGILNFTEQGDKGSKYGNIITQTISDFGNSWIKHPNVDLAILPIAGIIDNIKSQTNKDISLVYYEESLTPNAKLLEDITAIEEVLMIGYPKGFWDKVNNLPVVRKGITATPIYIDYNGKKSFF